MTIWPQFMPRNPRNRLYGRYALDRDVPDPEPLADALRPNVEPARQLTVAAYGCAGSDDCGTRDGTIDGAHGGHLYPTETDNATPGRIALCYACRYTVPMPTLGDRIAAARARAGLSQSELARRIGVAASAVNNWEHGKKLPKRDNIVLLASVLQTDVGNLLFDTNLSEQPWNDRVPTGHAGGRLVPHLAIADAALGRSATQDAPTVIAHFPCSDSSFWFELLDESMAPRLPRGTRAVWDPERKPRPGDVVLAIAGADGSVTIGEMTMETSPTGRVVIVTPSNPKWSAVRSDIESVSIVAVLSEATFKTST